jgi:hypothetical protein
MAPALLGGALIVVVYVLPDGIVGGLRRLSAWVRTRSAGKRGAPPGADPIEAPQPQPS